MRQLNVYTGTLFIIGLYATAVVTVQFNMDHWLEILLVIAMIVMFDLFPIKLPSGETFSISIVLVLYLMYRVGLSSAMFALLIGTFVSFLQQFGSLQKIKWSPFFVTFGMYYLAGSIAMATIRLTQHNQVYISTFLAASTFELTNTLLIAGIATFIHGTPLFYKFKDKLKELSIPVFVYTIFIPHFLNITDFVLLAEEIIFSGLFLLIIIYFSRKYIEQIEVRRSNSQQFIQLLETRLTPALAGHGQRVGSICEFLLQHIEYPKHRRHEVVQMAIIHDIGKSLLPAYMFQKRGALTLSEVKEYQRHCAAGADIVRTIYPNKPFADWILYHHEQWDGKGFPKGLQGEETPLEARILSLSNRLDHLLKQHTDDATVYQLLKDKAGTILDPSLIEKITVETIAAIRERLTYPNHAQNEQSAPDSGPVGAPLSYIGQSCFLRVTADDQVTGARFPIPMEKIVNLARLSRLQRKQFHEQLIHAGKTMEVHFLPFATEVVVFVNDITPALEYKKKTTRKILEAYRDVISSLSDNKVILCLTQDDLSEKLGEFIDSMEVNRTDDVPQTRVLVNKYISNFHSNDKEKMNILLAVSEAATNLIKHATQGNLSIFSKNNTLQVLISDKGSGIPLHELPKTILIAGYSSQRSLGKGFSIISRAASKVYLYTSSAGTAILLEFSFADQKTDLNVGA